MNNSTNVQSLGMDSYQEGVGEKPYQSSLFSLMANKIGKWLIDPPLFKIILNYLFFFLALSMFFISVAANPGTTENVSNDSSILLSQNIYSQSLSELGNRSAYISEKNDISMTFNQPGIPEQYFYQNFFTSNPSEPEDYFCIPDDFILTYNQNYTFRVKATALNWTTVHNLSTNKDTAVLINSFSEKSGFNPYYNNSSHYYGNVSSWQVPPLDIDIIHEMKYDENYVPMRIKVNNTFSEPMRIIYVFQDGAWMTSFDKGNQENIHYYWDDGASNSPRIWFINKENRESKNNWVGMYDDNNGGMFAGVYSPPQSVGIVGHATWNVFWMIGDSPNVLSMDNIFEGITGLPVKGHEHDKGRFQGTIIDFGTVAPGEEREQIIIKIMFSGYSNRTEMRNRLQGIIERIPDYQMGDTNLLEVSVSKQNLLSLDWINLPFPRNHAI